ncbi:single-stranded-DNA-specific exonuclease RecJ [bacterium Unc6]|nr:single-stranded-DNA-specific exonuclease RecJ [bacterium Unc6]
MKWIIQELSKDRELFSRNLQISPLLAQILLNRNIKSLKSAEEFLSCRYSSFHAHEKLLGIEKAKERIRTAIAKKEKIIVYGDYDADGITATALIVKFLKRFKVNAGWYIPDRIEEGYGISRQFLNNILSCQVEQAKDISLIITVDCGISAKDEIGFLQSKGIDVIVTDHHCIPKDGIPSAFACINPHQLDCSYPDDNLAGVGIAFKLIQSLQDNRVLEEFFDIVCIGTVADVVPLIGENRIFVKHGLRKLQYTNDYGISALINTSGLTGRTLRSEHIAFILGPRINAVGRLGDPNKAMQLLLSEDRKTAFEIARILEDANRERKRQEDRILREVQGRIEQEIDLRNTYALVIEGSGWSTGIIGIVASRIVDIYSRPCVIVCSDEKEIWKGSGRSIEKFNLIEGLNQCSDVLEKYGGHTFAAGIAIKKDNLARFKSKLNTAASDILKLEDLRENINVDASIELKDITPDFLEEMEKIEPFGQGNPKPIFVARNLKVKASSLTKDGKTIVWLTDGNVVYQGTIKKRLQNIKHYVSTPVSVDIAFGASLTYIENMASVKIDIIDLKISSVF